jgi:hypothetical protein
MPSKKETKKSPNRADKIDFYGHSLTNAGLEPECAKIEVIKRARKFFLGS